MKRLQKLKNLWHSNAGYAMIMVLCALLLFTVLGANAMLAAQASAGTTARKKDDTQAYVLAVSSLRCVADMIETGKFSSHIQTKILNVGAPSTDATGSPVYSAPATAQIELPEVQAGVQQPTVIVDFAADGIRSVANPSGGTTKVADLLTARITVQYLTASYSFLADFSQQPDAANPEQSKWRLKGYRENRVFVPPTA